MTEPKGAAGLLKEELAAIDKEINELLYTGEGARGQRELFQALGEPRGKLLRPTLLLLAARFGRDYEGQKQRLCRLAALLEIVHMASLIHDDIVDDSPLRRACPTIQSRFGKDLAVYAGDFMLSRVFLQLLENFPPQQGLLISRAIEEMCLGELGQGACRWDTKTTIRHYLENIRRKSVILFETAAKLGAAAGGATEHQRQILAGLGRELGFMFQLGDDLRDFLSCEGAEGKPVGQDFACGIYTLPALYVFRQRDYGEALRRLAEPAKNIAPPQKELLKLVAEGGGLEFTAARIAKHGAKAKELLSELPPQVASEGISAMISDFESAAKLPPLLAGATQREE